MLKKLKKIKSGTPVRVEWIDACTPGNGWMHPSEVKPMSICLSSAFFGKVDGDYLYLYQTSGSHGEVVNNPLLIPIANVKTIKALR